MGTGRCIEGRGHEFGDGAWLRRDADTASAHIGPVRTWIENEVNESLENSNFFIGNALLICISTSFLCRPLYEASK